MLTCRNCDAELRVKPCAALETGPWLDGELGDAELDATLPFGEPQEILPVPLGRVRTARTATFAPRTVREAAPLHRALAREPLDVDEAFVRDSGLVALGAETDEGRLAEALATCDDDAFVSVTDAFLASHYPLRLGAAAFCACLRGAQRRRRPLRPRAPPRRAASARPRARGDAARGSVPRARRLRGARPCDRHADARRDRRRAGGARRRGRDASGRRRRRAAPRIHVPPHAGDMSSPSAPPTVTVYHRTFRAMWERRRAPTTGRRSSGDPRDELEHHAYFLRGEDRWTRRSAPRPRGGPPARRATRGESPRGGRVRREPGRLRAPHLAALRSPRTRARGDAPLERAVNHAHAYRFD